MTNVLRLPSAGNVPRVSTTQEGSTMIIRIEAASPVLAPDELVAFPFGLEGKAAKALVRNGTLPTARIGRRTYARRSDVLALVEKLASRRAPPVESTDVSPEAAYARMVSR